MEQNQQELILKLSMLEQQIRYLQEQLQAIEQANLELNLLFVGLDDLNGKNGSEIYALYGRGIYVKAKLLSEDLLVDIGGKTFVKKNAEDCKKLIKEQLIKLDDIKNQLDSNLENVSNEISKTILESEKNERTKN
ncbi:MAG TPA: prefoldin subunit alpha [Candidatus Nanoarchaeia archaeon]|nr:prefoldin subunit alpha [Candidatus Nanoarchaeia archaeon]